MIQKRSCGYRAKYNVVAYIIVSDETKSNPLAHKLQ
jgi:hypothetical protein